jgi:hypothetical protein
MGQPAAFALELLLKLMLLALNFNWIQLLVSGAVGTLTILGKMLQILK